MAEEGGLAELDRGLLGTLRRQTERQVQSLPGSVPGLTRTYSLERLVEHIQTKEGKRTENSKGVEKGLSKL